MNGPDRKQQPPWVVPVRVEEVPENGRHIDLQADEATRAALAGFTGLRTVESASASFDVSRHGRDGLHVIGEVRARIGQTCVVTLEPMESEIAELVDIVFKPAVDGVVPAETIEAEGEDPPEELVGGAVDLGALATEFLILGVDPYPRKADAVFETPDAGKDKDGPFAALAKLKSRGEADK